MLKNSYERAEKKSLEKNKYHMIDDLRKNEANKT